MVNSIEFAKRLQEILDYYRISATDFSKKIAFNRSTISHILSGRNKPSLEFVMKVVHTFSEVELYWLLNGKGSFPISKNENSKFDLTESGIKKDSDVQPKIISRNNTLDKNASEIEKIVFFYKDGTFKTYNN